MVTRLVGLVAYRVGRASRFGSWGLGFRGAL